AGGKMGMRIGANLARSDYTVYYCENAPAGRERLAAQGRECSDTHAIIGDCDLVILAVPDIALAAVSSDLVPRMRSDATLLTLDPAAAYANVLHQRGNIDYAVAHPCHPSVFLDRRTDAEYADAFGGAAAAQ